MPRLPALLLLALLAACSTPPQTTRPSDFVYLDTVLHEARYDVRYFNGDNFTGNRVDGYRSARIQLTRPAAQALASAEQELFAQGLGLGLGLKIFDGYRPQRAVEFFKRWAADPQEQRMKARFYPELDKRELFDRGYIAKQSGHSRGSTVDLTLIDAHSGKELDMGSPFDFFGPISHHDTPLISPAQRHNRQLLRDLMRRHGFEPYTAEWWHYRLRAEPYPDTYFDFPAQ
ncbi:M15 family metallopeptidase [Pseudomonas sp. UL073]|uniref:D-alanyl-D-alanine dipeptidase n=1 Tax=Zestomonas insulae TaxID=2809017 RepID=A0ABS2IE48_9GAMM|nr:M15 family metallopeptidase [Pseudomonas insulae]MBM7061361.1 M15 family metallopeptidase [Pseudomonas insulae]